MDVFAGHLHLLFLNWQLVVVPHLEAVAQPTVGEEPVGGEEAQYGDDQVEKLAEDEAEVVDVVLVVDVVSEELQMHHISRWIIDAKIGIGPDSHVKKLY